MQHGILERRPYQERPLRHEYLLTEKGRDLAGVILSLMRWGDRWLDRGEGAPYELVHSGCGGVATPILVCSECGEPLEHAGVTLRPGAPLLRAQA